MAIHSRPDESDAQKPKLKIELDNGDLQALRNVIKKWGFKDEASLLRFILAVMLVPENKAVYVDSNGVKRKLEPIEELLAEEKSNGKTAQ